MDESTDTRPEPAAGLCARCAHVRRVRSGRGSLFYLCGRSLRDPRFRKYPPLPVVACPGFEPVASAGSPSAG